MRDEIAVLIEDRIQSVTSRISFAAVGVQVVHREDVDGALSPPLEIGTYSRDFLVSWNTPSCEFFRPLVMDNVVMCGPQSKIVGARGDVPAERSVRFDPVSNEFAIIGGNE